MHRLLRHILYLLVMLALPLVSAANDQVSALFKKGNEQYAKAQYKEAALSYRKILDGGYRSAALYYNLGNACYKMGKIPDALLYYEKAHKLSPDDEDISANIRFVNLKTTDKIEEVPQFFLSAWWQAFILILPVHTLAVLTVVFLLAGFLLLIVYLFAASVSLKRTSFYAAIVLVFLGLLAIFISSRQTHYFTSHHQAIVFAGSVTVKSEPAEGSKDLFVIHEGAKVSVLETENDWMKIELPNGNVGWIPASDARKI